MNDKREYINGLWIKEITFSEGGSLLKVSLLPDKTLPQLKKLKPNEDGFIKLVIAKSKNPVPSSTHYCYVDDYVPSSKAKSSTESKSKGATKQKSEPDEETLI